MPQNPEGLFEVIRNSKSAKGDDPVVTRLDDMFDKGWYWHGNEPCHQIPYLYDAAGAPEKTQERVHHILNTEYNDTPGGLSGNDDAGQMSAWYVFSSIGFYPVCPGTPEYYIGTPSFDKVTLNLENGKRFVLSAQRRKADDYLIQSTTLNGNPWSDYRISHQQILQGGELHFEMKATK